MNFAVLDALKQRSKRSSTNTNYYSLVSRQTVRRENKYDSKLVNTRNFATMSMKGADIQVTRHMYPVGHPAKPRRGGAKD